jgi:amino acid adenylation domain-containing protein
VRHYTSRTAGLRAEVRSVLSDPALRVEADSCRADGLPWAPQTYRELGRRGLLAPQWSTEFGGLGGSVSNGAMVAEELALHGVPDTARANGVDNLGSTLLAVGTEQQRRQWLPRIAHGEVFGTVLYSEYEAGSDLSVLQTRARQDGDGWRLRGTKVWNVRSDLATMGVVAARTNLPNSSTAEHGFAAITLFLVELDLPGVRVKPLESINVEGFTEVSFDDVRVGPENVLGGVGNGWAAVSGALSAERTGACFAGRARRWLDELRLRIGPDPADRSALKRIAALDVQVEASRALSSATVGDLTKGQASDADLAACKWISSEVARQVAVAAWEYEGTRALPAGQAVPPAWFALREAPGLTLAAGTSEMMLRTVTTALLDEAHTDIEALDAAALSAVTAPTEWRVELYADSAQEAARAAAAEDAEQVLSTTLCTRNWRRLTIEADAGGLGLDHVDGIALAKALGRAGAPEGPLDSLRLAELAATTGKAGGRAVPSAAMLRTAAYTLGIAQRALLLAARAIQHRHQFGASLATRQGVTFPLAAAHAQCRALDKRVAMLARAIDRGHTITADAQRLLGTAASTAVEACRQALQAHGASGLIPEAGVEACYRWALRAGSRFGSPTALLSELDSDEHTWHLEDDEACDIAVTEPQQLQRRRIPSSWNDTDAPLPEAVTVADLVAKSAERHPDAVALSSSQGALSYGELLDRVCGWAARLIELGVGPDEVVGISLDRSIDMVVAVLAVLEAGAAYLPLDPHLPAQRMKYLIADSGTKLILTHDATNQRPPSGPQLIRMDCEVQPSATHRVRGARPDNLAYLMYTSGSTGAPKGVEVEHRSVVNRLLWDHRRFGLGPGDAILMHTSLSFDISVWEIFGTLTTGARLVLLGAGEDNDPAQMARVLRDEQITVLAVVPSLLDLLLDDEPGLNAATALRYVFSGGEALHPALCQRVFAATTAELHNFYGPTEATIDVTSWHCTPDNLCLGVPIGQPLDNVRTYVLHQGEPVPVGLPGELHVAGAGLARGYRGRPDLTAQRFVPDTISGRGGRLYRTGDLVRYRSDGALEFLGRLDDQVRFAAFASNLEKSSML